MIDILLFIIIGIFGSIFLLKIVDLFRFKDEMKFEKMIEDSYRNMCLKQEEIHTNLSDNEKIFLQELKEHIKCKNFSLSSEIYLRDIFCLYVNNTQSKRLKELMFFTKENYYCTSSVYALYNFVEVKFIKYLGENKTISATEINLSLLGSENLEEDEVIDKLLEMSTLEFIQKFSILSGYRKGKGSVIKISKR